MSPSPVLPEPSITDPSPVSAASRPAVVSRLWPAFKRALDVFLAAILLTAALPLFVLIAAAIKLDSRGPVLFRVRRSGYRGHALEMLKFRKMHHHAEGGPLTIRDDQRLTRVGAILTRTRLDELPQLWDVLRGRMSIIGPRPEDPRFVALHAAAYERILEVRPGITGLTQLAFSDEASLLGEADPVGYYVDRLLPQKVGLDCFYANHYRPSMDLAVLRWTFVAVLLRRPVAVNRATGEMSIRRRAAGAEEAALAEPVPVAEDTGSATATI